MIYKTDGPVRPPKQNSAVLPVTFAFGAKLMPMLLNGKPVVPTKVAALGRLTGR
jgi:hypothetical protein